MKLVINSIFIRYPKKNDGISRYSFEIVCQLINKIEAKDMVYLAVDRYYKYNYLKCHIAKKNVKIVFIPFPTFFLIARKIWSKVIIYLVAKFVNANCVWAPDGISTYNNSRINKYITVHDLNYLFYPQNLKNNHLRYFIHEIKRSLASAKNVFTVSNFSKNEIIKYFQIEPDKIIVAYNGVEFSALREPDYSKYQNKYGNLRFIYTVGNLEPRKNLIKLIETFFEISRYDPSIFLLVTGSVSWKSEDVYKLIGKYGLSSRIIFTGYIEETELAYLYANCLTFVYIPSYEGFGFPIIEAIYCGAKVVASDIPVFREIANDYCIFVDLNSKKSIISGIHDSIKNDRLYSEEMRNDLKNRFKWEKSGLIHFNSIFLSK